ncbi:MAG TPA: hypothetical protein VHA10_01925 [Hypericibacter adhaerens]|uniref:Uncharacterized protein n=1 Tax=Hypericibacter adhaerens TaxID=2602016 RepID=A0A5J6N356_9PROT|nr:hypothetical protein [Hypericibacter adhaerens]QEX24179.1 hypothetical protein FRZ61_41200 [Hypericibacter adhaerens]HWA41939.1 hypothetical protein [Hypericibacter adhaerens]
MAMPHDPGSIQVPENAARREALPEADAGDALSRALTADLLVLQSLAKALRADGAITEQTLDRAVADALRRLLAADGPSLPAEALREVARLIDDMDREIRERIRAT